MAEPPHNSERRDLTGQVLANRYRIVDLIGEGAMGQVWRGMPVNGGAPVAIKVVHANLSTNATVIGRFKSEAMAASRLIHPNTVRVLDFGEAPGRMLYMVMEYLRGQNLDALLERIGRLSEKRTLAIGVQILDALVAAHRNNIIHRDLKPENVMLVKGDTGEEQVKVLDFGIAKVLDPLSPDDPTGIMTLTRAGAVVGTPAYMSPEQATGERIDPRSDIFSAGVTLYHMITGIKPFRAQTLVGLLQQVISVDPPRVSSCISTVDPRVEAIIHCALQKQAEHRFQTAQQMRAALQHVIESSGRGLNMAATPIPNTMANTVAPPPALSGPPAPTPAVGRGAAVAPPPPGRLRSRASNISGSHGGMSASPMPSLGVQTFYTDTGTLDTPDFTRGPRRRMLAIVAGVSALAGGGFLMRWASSAGPSVGELTRRVDIDAWGAAESYALEHFDFFARLPETGDLIRRSLAMRRMHFADVWRQRGLRHDPAATVEPGYWRGEAKFPDRPERYRFTLVIESVTPLTVRGYSDWPGLGVRVKTEGYRDGNHLLLWDCAYLFQGRSSMGFTLFDKKSLFLDGDRLMGFEGPYRAVIEGQRVPNP